VRWEGTARIWFTRQQRAELWERWKNGQCVADIARALEPAEERALISRRTAEALAAANERYCARQSEDWRGP
jgi:hypothetical protein